ncbi:MAG TPA: AAA family ATPase [Gemmatimonadaceae bacterium]|nr:AAA family ATPase [Gemmatimonadaceae bacterium]
MSVLERFTRDLTAEAREGRLEPIRSRAEEIARVIDILLRHGKNNPALVGPAGVGKTAIVEGLAQRLVVGAVPLGLRDTRILAVDHVALLAGTTYRGQYEERIRGLVAETRADPTVILFIDELHNLIGQGTALGAAMDAANMLKPSLVRGDFRVIGATTEDEYDRWIRGDPALERRFQRIVVRELTAEETLDVINARRGRLERHHNVVITDEAVRASVELTDKHQLDRHRPDRAIDALDEACAHSHAVARYSAESERLIKLRRQLVSQRQRTQTSSGSQGNEVQDDALENFARDGISALQRFGAELEAMFVGGDVGIEVPPQRPAAPTPPVADAPLLPNAESLETVEAALRTRLITEGIVVKGVDVARVVALATGTFVSWTSDTVALEQPAPSSAPPT